ncbi:MAG TPA: twin-arginine translocation signal domain-containing protein, partial [Gemmatimonadetes bacterium]|nr:twin-arginine translocation signal domain-containing protein [Gemmatimonadota bacterium]
MTDSKGRRSAISRRDLLKTAGAAGAAALVPGAVAGVNEEKQPTPIPVGPLTNLTANETEILSAMVDRLI